nr:hypothetical protein [Haliscomenobacter sp.]
MRKLWRLIRPSCLPALNLVRWRLKSYFNQNGEHEGHAPGLSLENNNSSFSEFIQQNQLAAEDTLLLTIALAPHLNPQFLDTIIQESLPQPGDFPQIGGVRGKNFRGFLPTGETALFLLAGDDPESGWSCRSCSAKTIFLPKSASYGSKKCPKESRL